ncbi:MAG: HAMP domain-containing protein [Deltaproteobacteria bacterium]|nr:HAMP domain-containing protein [Deltaproteobacteria bacterium]
MFRSIKTKFILLVFLILGVTAGFILHFSNQDAYQAMYAAQQSAARNIIHLINLNVQAQYSDLVSDKLNTTLRRKKLLESNALAARAVIDGYVNLMALARVEKPQDELLAMLDQSGALNFGGGAGIFLCDPEARVVLHSDRSWVGSNIGQVKDIKNRRLGDVIAFEHGNFRGDFSLFTWPARIGEGTDTLLGFFVPLGHWGWTVGAVIDVGEVEAEALARQKEVVKILDKSFAEISITDSSYIFLFDGHKNMLIHPDLGASDFQSLTNALTEQNLMEDLMASIGEGPSAIEYEIISAMDHQSRLMAASVSYFKPLDWYVVVAVPVDEIKAPAQRLVLRQSMVILSVLVVSLLLAIPLVHHVTRPINQLADYARGLAGQDFTADEPQILPPDVRGRDEVGQLAQAFMHMEGELRRNIRNLMETTATKERIQGELSAARDIQEGILKRIFPPFPDRSDIDLYAALKSAKEVGGDLYDFFFTDPDHLCFVIGDVSDKGVPAALFMSVTITLVRSTAKKLRSPGEIMSMINSDLCRENPNSMFVTLFIGVLNVRTGHVVYSNGGHNPMVLMRPNHKPEYQKGVSGPVVGGMEGIDYQNLEMILEPGQALFLYTDGVTEAMDPDQALFGDDHLLEVLECRAQDSPTSVIDSVFEDIHDFCRNAPQSDDITMLMLRFYGPDGPDQVVEKPLANDPAFG